MIRRLNKIKKKWESQAAVETNQDIYTRYREYSMDATQNRQTQRVSNREVGDGYFITHSLVQKCPAPPSPVSLYLRLLLVQR